MMLVVIVHVLGGVILSGDYIFDIFTFVFPYLVFSLALPDERCGRGRCSRTWRIFMEFGDTFLVESRAEVVIPACTFSRSRETF